MVKPQVEYCGLPIPCEGPRLLTDVLSTFTQQIELGKRIICRNILPVKLGWPSVFAALLYLQSTALIALHHVFSALLM